MSGDGAESAILFAEVPDFYAEVERRSRPELEGRPILVGGDPGKRGRVQSLSAEARDAGVHHGMAMQRALELCPGAVRLPTDMRRYREVSGALVSCLRGLFEAVETAGLGSAYADVHGGSDAPVRAAEPLVPLVRAELGLPLRVGIAPSKFLARLAAEEAGPGSVYRLRGSDTADFLGPLPVSRLPRVGSKTGARLAALGARTVGEILELGASVLESELGNHGLAILEMARGQDRSPMRVARYPQSVSRAETLAEASADLEVLGARLERLAVALAADLARQGLGARRVALRLVGAAGATETRSVTLGRRIGNVEEIHRTSRQLLERGEAELRRGLALVLAGLGPMDGDDRQLELF